MNQWERAKQLFAQALQLGREEREQFLATTCAGEDSLRRELESLLSAHVRAEGFIESPVLANPTAAALIASIEGNRDTRESTAVGRTTSPADPLVGRVLSRYRLEEPLGAGGMGVLYRAKDLKLGRTVAVKLLARHLLTDETAKARFLREARAASALDHPNIGTVHDIGEENGELFIVMVLYQGKTLKQRLEGERPAIDEALTIARQLLLGLEVAHRAGIIHRDIKPANILITSSGTVKLLDFGLAKLACDSQAQSMTDTGQALGTVLYMSPEQLRGGPVDSRSDLWSLGVVIYEVLAGVSPFQADSSAATAIRILHDEPASLTTFAVADWLAELISQLLRKNPTDRPQTASEALQRLDRGESRSNEARRGAPRPPTLSSMLYPVRFTDENGLEIERQIPKHEFHQRVVALSFDNETGDPDLNWLSEGVASLLEMDLSQDPFIVSHGRVPAIAEAPYDARLWDQMTKSLLTADSLVPLALKRELAQSVNMEYFLTGAFQMSPDGYALRVELYRTKQARRIAKHAYRGPDLFHLIDEATVQVRRDLEIPAQHIETMPQLPVKEIYTSSLDALREYILARRDRLVSNDRQAAATHYERAIRADPSFALAYLRLAIAYQGLNQGDKSRAACAAALRNQYKMREQDRFYLREFQYFTQKEPEKSLSVLKQWVTLYPEDVFAHEMLAIRLHQRCQLSKEAEVRSQILALDRGSIEQLIKLGEIHSFLGEFEKELEYYKEYVRRSPRAPVGYVRLASAYQHLTRYEEVKSAYQDALAREPDNVDALIGLGTLQMLLGEFSEALHTYEDSLKRSHLPQEKEKAYAAERNYYSIRRQWRRAVEAAALSLQETKAYASLSSVVRAEVNNIPMYIKSGQHEKAINFLSSIEQQLKENGESALFSGYLQWGYVLLYAEQGNGAKVIPAAGRLNQLRRTALFFSGQGLGVELRLQGKGYELTKDYEKAIESYEQSLQANARSYEGVLALGRCYRLKNDLEKAEASLLRALKLFPAYPEAHYELSVLYAKIGNFSKAREHLKTALGGWSEADADDAIASEARALASTLPP